MRQPAIALIVVLGLSVAACDTGSRPQQSQPQSQGQAKPAEKTVDIVKSQREALEKSKAVQGTVDTAAEYRQKPVEQTEGY